MITQQALFIFAKNFFLFFFSVIGALTISNFCRALSARIFGDRTAQRYGFLTLNPAQHLDVVSALISFLLFFSLMQVFTPHGGNSPVKHFFLIIAFMFIFRGLIVAPINEKNLKGDRLGGFFCYLFFPILMLATISLLLNLNVICSFLVFHVFNLKGAIHVIKTISEFLFHLSRYVIFLATIQLIPVPPFAMGRAIYFLLPKNLQESFRSIEMYSSFIILFVVIFINEIPFLNIIHHLISSNIISL